MSELTYKRVPKDPGGFDTDADYPVLVVRDDRTRTFAVTCNGLTGLQVESDDTSVAAAKVVEPPPGHPEEFWIEVRGKNPGTAWVSIFDAEADHTPIGEVEVRVYGKKVVYV